MAPRSTSRYEIDHSSTGRATGDVDRLRRDPPALVAKQSRDHGTDVVGLNRTGVVLPGWPAHLTAGEARLQLAPDGRLFAILVNPDDPSAATLAYLAPTR